jgi:AAA+ ATPase superfamily predicted ATPase
LYFDPAPKDRREDFFDREEELERLKSLSSPIILVLGLRRTGKSSLIRIALRELGRPYVYLDMRKFEERRVIRYRDFLGELEREVNRLLPMHSRLASLLRNVQGVSIMGNEVRFKWQGRDRLSFVNLLASATPRSTTARNDR